MHRNHQPERLVIRSAVYCRKSTAEGLDSDFNSLDAQREAGEAFIRSQAGEGWCCVPGHYDDGGFTGGNMDRPALKRLIADIEAGRIDVIVVYKVDRLSRSLLDFARLMEIFERYNVAFVSVTQQINTGNSMGRLMMNVLLSFAQFEREIVSERTRDKIAATRRKGKWSGGRPVLGYDVDRETTRLIVNEDEAAKVRAIFELYLEHQALLPVVAELDRRGWVSKRGVTKGGYEYGGKPFTKTGLYQLLTNVIYLGKVRYKAEIHAGEHAAIIDADLWQNVQSTLQRNGRSGSPLVRNKFGALLKGILHCVPCKCAMVPSHSTRKGNLRYRYYVCSSAQKRGWTTCPSKSVPAGEIEAFVVQQIKRIGKDPALVEETLKQVRSQSEARIAELEAERRGLGRELARWTAEVGQLTQSPPDAASGARVADLQERIRAAERRTTELHEQALALNQQLIGESEVAEALSSFDPLWESLTPREQTQVFHLLVKRVDYDGANGKVAITFHPTGIKALGGRQSNGKQESAA